MKRKFLAVFAIFVLAITLVMSCSPAATEPTKKTTPANLNPNVTITSTPAAITSFTASKNYTPATVQEVTEIYDAMVDALVEAIEDMDSLADAIQSQSSNNHAASVIRRSALSRAAKALRNETFNGSAYDFLALMIGGDEGGEPPAEVTDYLKVDGYVDATASFYEGGDDNPFPITLNGSSKFRFDVKEGLDFGKDAPEVFGSLGADVKATNIVIKSEEEMSGKLLCNIDLAVNIGIPKEEGDFGEWAGKSLKCIANISSDADLGSKAVAAAIKIKLYAGADLAVSDTITIKVTYDYVTVSFAKANKSVTISLM